MRKCKVCGKILRLKKENKYLVLHAPTGLNCLVEATETFECFDCPKCGCQNIVNIRETRRTEQEVQDGIDVEN